MNVKSSPCGLVAFQRLSQALLLLLFQAGLLLPLLGASIEKPVPRDWKTTYRSFRSRKIQRIAIPPGTTRDFVGALMHQLEAQNAPASFIAKAAGGDFLNQSWPAFQVQKVSAHEAMVRAARHLHASLIYQTYGIELTQDSGTLTLVTIKVSKTLPPSSPLAKQTKICVFGTAPQFAFDPLTQRVSILDSEARVLDDLQLMQQFGPVTDIQKRDTAWPIPLSQRLPPGIFASPN